VLVNADVARELESLLAESVEDAVQRERTTFDATARGTDGIVLVGIGGLGRRVLRALREAGVEPLALADNGTRLQGASVEGHEVISVPEAVRRHGAHATFVVTIWGAGSTHRFADTRKQLESLGARAVSAFPSLLWKYPATALPHYCQDFPHRVLEQREQVRLGLDVWSDESSRREYLSQVRLRLMADFDGLAHPVAHPQYFPTDLFEYGPAECFVDCGAFDGDTIRTLIERHGAAIDRIVALEPDPVNVAVLERYASTLRLPAGIEVLPLAAGAARGRAFIETTGTASSALAASAVDGTAGIDLAPLDDLLEHERPTFIKMDIEGAEPDALRGARTTIVRRRPLLAICVYHLQDHLWSIPLFLRELCEDYDFFLRPHNEEGWDLVCYGVPRERSMPRGRRA
jgi:FkbM family methyltransferase